MTQIQSGWRSLLWIPILLLATSWTGAAERVSEYEWTGVSRIVAVGDVHGSYDHLTRLLRASHVIDDEQRWSSGEDHLVLVGDLIDRGRGDRAVLDFLRALKIDAEKVGGRVHVLVGNHEVMNLVRDLRYVNPDSYVDYVDLESDKLRRAGLKRFKRRTNLKAEELQAEFDRLYPPGFFGRLAAFNPGGIYGSWLLQRPVLVKLNGVLFVHGGLTEQVADLGVAGINERISQELAAHLKARSQLEVRAIVDSTMTFSEAQQAAGDFWERNRLRGDQGAWLSSAQKFGELPDSPLFGEEGPLWYRGFSIENERVERDRFDRTLTALNARALVVAHSPTNEKRITSRFGGRLYRVDHGMAYAERPLALILKDQVGLVFDPGVEGLEPPLVESPRGARLELGRGTMSDAEVAVALKEGRVVSSRELGRGSTRPKLLEIEFDEHLLRGLFKSIDQERDCFRHEVAAFELDRMLGLGLVPVTVVRTVNEETGSLQEWIEEAVDGVSIVDYGLSVSEPAALEERLRASQMFDYLIGNQDRSERDLLYLVEQSDLRCVDHSKAFVTAPGEPPIEIEPRWMKALEALQRDEFERQLEPWLSSAEREAVWRRTRELLPASPLRSGLPRQSQLRPATSRLTMPLRPQSDAGGEDPLDWDQARREKFLLEAKIVATKFIGEGITRPKKVTLELDGVTRPAAFKYHDEFRPGVTQFSDGPREVNFRDSYLFDRAAYLLDQELGLGMVPVTVLREVDGQQGALVWWIDDAISEADRLGRAISPPDPKMLRNQQEIARLFYALVENTDDNMQNQLITLRDWRVHMIDLTRAFRFSRNIDKKFKKKELTLPRSLHQRLQELDRGRLIEMMDGVLSSAQVGALLSRRDAILQKIDADIKRLGESAVFQDESQ